MRTSLAMWAAIPAIRRWTATIGRTSSGRGFRGSESGGCGRALPAGLPPAGGWCNAELNGRYAIVRYRYWLRVQYR